MRKLLGYRLKEECEKYRSAALKICNTIINWENSLEKYDISIEQANYIKRLIQAGVMHWFEEVYEEEKPKYKKNVWYKTKDNSIICSTKDQDVLKSGYGVSNFYGNWYDNDSWIETNGSVEATTKEIEEALIKEAKKRGFKEGVKCNNSNVIDSKVKNNYLYGQGGFEYEDGALFWVIEEYTNYRIFDNGKWAEIIDEPKTFSISSDLEITLYTNLNGKTAIIDGVEYELKLK